MRTIRELTKRLRKMWSTDWRRSLGGHDIILSSKPAATPVPRWQAFLIFAGVLALLTAMWTLFQTGGFIPQPSPNRADLEPGKPTQIFRSDAPYGDDAGNGGARSRNCVGIGEAIQLSSRLEGN
jgi:hypothetical protein